MALSDWAHRVNDSESARLINHRKVKARSACALRPFTVWTELAAQQPSSQRTPDHQAKLLVLHQRQHLTFQVTPSHGVIGLHAFEAGPVIPIRNRQSFHDLPGSHIAQTYVAHLA